MVGASWRVPNSGARHEQFGLARPPFQGKLDPNHCIVHRASSYVRPPCSNRQGTSSFQLIRCPHESRADPSSRSPINYSDRIAPHFLSSMLRYPIGVLYSCARFTFLYKSRLQYVSINTTASLYLSQCLQVIVNESPWPVKAASVPSSDHSSSSGCPSGVILPPHPHLYKHNNSPK